MFLLCDGTELIGRFSEKTYRFSDTYPDTESDEGAVGTARVNVNEGT
jgi:hypothetical protein